MGGLINGERKKPFLIGVAGGTASGKVKKSGKINVQEHWAKLNFNTHYGSACYLQNLTTMFLESLSKNIDLT